MKYKLYFFISLFIILVPKVSLKSQTNGLEDIPSFDDFNFDEEEIIDIGSPVISRIPVFVDTSKISNLKDRIYWQDKSIEVLLATGYFNKADNSSESAYQVNIVENEFGDYNLEFLDNSGTSLVNGLMGKRSLSGTDLIIRFANFVNEFVLTITNNESNLGTAIVYLEQNVNKPGSGRIVMTDSLGLTRKVLVDNRRLNLYPRISQDGRKLSYISLTRNGYLLFIMDLDSGKTASYRDQYSLLSGGAWFNNGKSVAYSYSTNANSDIHILNIADKTFKKVLGSSAIETSVTLSGDNSRIAYVSDRTGYLQLYVYDFNNPVPLKLTEKGKYNSDPNWNPKSDEIVFCSLIGGVLELMLLKISTNEIFRITKEGRSSEQPRWSPDGIVIAYTGSQSSSKKIFVITKDGKQKRRLTQSPNSIIEKDVSWSKRKLW